MSQDFATRVCDWQRQHGRHQLPWQGTRDPYRIWLSEIMLQQTQVATVIPYYERFLARFPDIATLAAAEQEAVMPYWAGLGYYARARNLHRCAQALVSDHNGRFPAHSTEIAQLPGIGRSTAAAIAAFAYGERSPIMDGNVKRVFTRYFGVHGYSGQRAVEQQLWGLAETAVDAAPPELDMAAYTQGLMDLGSQVCTRGTPGCDQCPLAADCVANRQGLQKILPEPRPRKAIPDRHCAMLLLHGDGHVLLEKQPDSGIWGGLWSLPRYDNAESLLDACRGMGVAAGNQDRMAGFVHTFTHFRLHIDPWRLQTGLPLASPGAGRCWTPFEQLEHTAVPAPVRSLLDALPLP